MDLELLLRTVTECVQKGQQRLKKEFLYRIDITQLDLNDRRLKKTFYDLQPNQEQVGQERKKEKNSLSPSLLFNSRCA